MILSFYYIPTTVSLLFSLKIEILMIKAKVQKIYEILNLILLVLILILIVVQSAAVGVCVCVCVCVCV